MITCSECLTGLSTSRLSDIRAGSPVAMHYAGCERCLTIVHDLQAAERGLGAALDQFGPRAITEDIVEGVANSAFRRRRRIARVFRAALGIAGFILFAVAMEALLERDQLRPPTPEPVVAPAEPLVPAGPGVPPDPGVTQDQIIPAAPDR